MKRAILGAVALLAGCATPNAAPLRESPSAAVEQPMIGSRAVPLLEIKGLRFRDLNRSGALDPYEDWRLSPDVRVGDLVKRMTLPEKAGAMMHGTAPLPGDALHAASYDKAAARTLILDRNVTSMITRLSTDPAAIASENNAIQQIAEEGRLGIPLTISSDPRNHFQYVPGASVSDSGFSQWPETTGFGALRDEALVRRFGDIARQEYRAVGIHQALSPQADVATEPRWARIGGTFGEEAGTAGRLAAAYIEGFQGGPNGVRRDGVSTIVKHWVGYGAAKDGWDSHNHYGRHATFPGGRFDYHVSAFLPALAAKPAGVMPTYSILEGLVLEGRPVEQVGVGFNKQMLTGELRARYNYDGLILSDWLITSDCPQACVEGSNPCQPFVIAMPWGVESLARERRFIKAVDAGIDQFGGADDTGLLVHAVQDGAVQEARLEESARRVMAMKFAQGLFENPFVNPAQAGRLVGSKAFQAPADDAQRRSLVLLRNEGRILPLAKGRKVYLVGISADVASRFGLVPVARVEDADVALVRTDTPWQVLHPRYFFGLRQHEGSLAFALGQSSYDEIVRIGAKVPTIVTIFLDRPAVLTALQPHVRAIIGNFGVDDANLLAVVTGMAAPQGRLPFELPSSMAAVQAQKSDVPHDTCDPLYAHGFGLDYAPKR